MAREVKKVGRSRKAPRVNVGDVTQLEGRVREYLKQIEDLNATISYLRDQLTWREEARDGHKAAADTLAGENKRLRERLDQTADARLEVARLEGVLYGLERAGKIEAVDNGTMRFG